MHKSISRRTFLGGAAGGSAVAAGGSVLAVAARSALSFGGAGAVALSVGCGRPAPAPEDLDFPIVDYHAHPSKDVPLAEVVRLCEERSVKLGIVEHAGAEGENYADLISTDEAMKRHIAMLAPFPVYKGIQAEGLNWPACFSKDVVAQLDYALSDALTLPQKDGTREEIWRPSVTIDDKQEFMDRYTDFNVEVMAREPIDIMANPLFLPKRIAEEFDLLWTELRMRRIADAAVKYNVAIEINSRYQLPGLKFLRMAKDAGARFSFGTNTSGSNVGKLDYSIAMAKKLKLTSADIFTPAPPGKKPIQIRTFG